MSTRSIVWGKWWGAFRRVPWLAFWPTLVAFSLLQPNSQGWMVALVYLTPMLIIAQGAALAGLGLALATWISRAGRAVSWTISALVASVIGWPVVAFLVFPNTSNTSSRDLQLAIVMGSPFYNAAMPTVTLENHSRGGMPGSMENGIFQGSIAWTMAYASMALALYLATLRTFDRCLGRTSERPLLPDPDPSRAAGSAKAVKPHALRGLGWRTRLAGGRPATGASSSGRPPR